MDRSIYIVGAAGEGIQTIGEIVARAFLAHGYSVFTVKEYESRIRGGNSSYRLRVADTPKNAPRHDADVLLALNGRARDHYAPSLRPEGILLGSEEIPFVDLAESEAGAKIYANSVAAGALCAAVGLPMEVLEAVLREVFERKGEKAVDRNLAAARAGHRAASGGLSDSTVETLPRSDGGYAFTSAHEVIPIAAAAAGCRFMAAYPMSPSTGIITSFARDPELGVFFEQAEDEISAINMTLGASAAGARAMTATSGGGFALMAEGISLAGMTETPIVIVLAQRPGPATGLPTRTAQEDLLFAIHAGHGEFPRVVLAPADPQDAIDQTVRAFDLAERFQIPVVLLTDQFLADSNFSLPPFRLPASPSRPSRVKPPADSSTDYARYALTENGISPRLVFGQTEQLVCIDGDEHTEAGHITEDLREIRPAMVEKRLAKMRGLAAEVAPPVEFHTDGAGTVLVGWGSTRNALLEAVECLRDDGRSVGLVHFTQVWPLPPVTFDEGQRVVVVEGNATGQFARLLRSELGVEVDTVIGRSDGLPIDGPTVVRELT